MLRLILPVLLLTAAPALAAPAPAPPPSPTTRPDGTFIPPVAEPGFVAPRFSDEWWARMRQLPDFNGSWANLGGFVFNAENKYTPPDPANGEGGDRGPPAGDEEPRHALQRQVPEAL